MRAAPVSDGGVGRARLTRPARLWIAAAIVPVLALVLLGVIASSVAPGGPAMALPNDPSATSADAVRWRAEQTLPVSAMPGWIVTRDYEVAQADLVKGGGIAMDNTRNRSVRGAHQRVFDSLDGTYRLSLQVWEMTTTSRGSYRHTNNVAVPGAFPPGSRAYIGRDDAEGRGLVLEMSRGRMFVEMVLEAPPVTQNGPPTEAMVSTLARVAALEAPRLRESPDLNPADADRSDQLHWLLIALVLGYLLWFQLLIALAASSVDRGVRDHLKAWFSRDPHRAPVGVVDLPDVGDEIRSRHRRHRRSVLVRSAVIGGLIVVVYESNLGSGILGGVAILAATGFALAALDVLRERRRSRRSSGSAPSMRVSLGLLAASACSVVLGAGGALVVFFVAMSVILDPPDMTPEQKQGALLGWMAVGIGCFLLADVPMRLVRRYALARASREASSDRRREVLFLRSFADDGLRVRVRRGSGGSTIERWSLRRREGFEQLVVLALRGLGPVVAIGEPGTKLPPLGATRQYYGEEWRAEVDRLAQTSQLVVLIVGRSRGVVEEIERVRTAGLLFKCLFVLPPLGTAEVRARLRVLSAAFGIEPDVLRATDETGARILAISVGPDGRLICWRGVGRTDIAYQVVLETASARAVLAPDTRVHDVRAPLNADDPGARELLVTSANRADAARVRWRERRRRAWVPIWALCGIVSLLASTAGPADKVPVPGVPLTTAAVLWLGQRPDGGLIGLSTDTHRFLALSPTGATPLIELPEQALTASVGGGGVLVSATRPDSVIALKGSAGGIRAAWRTRTSSRPGRSAVVGDRVVVLLPQSDRAAVLDMRTGRQLGVVALPRGPRDVAVVGSTVLVAGQTDATLSVLDPVKMRVVRTTKLPVSPFVLKAAGPDLFVGSIADNAVLRLDVNGRVRSRAPVPQYGGLLAVSRGAVTVGTYGEVASVVALQRETLQIRATTPSPDNLDYALGDGDRTWAAFTEKRAVVALP